MNTTKVQFMNELTVIVNKTNTELLEISVNHADSDKAVIAREIRKVILSVYKQLNDLQAKYAEMGESWSAVQSIREKYVSVLTAKV